MVRSNYTAAGRTRIVTNIANNDPGLQRQAFLLRRIATALPTRAGLDATGITLFGGACVVLCGNRTDVSA
jgi:hypothetical protein